MNNSFVKISTGKDVAIFEVVKDYKKISSHILNKDDLEGFKKGLEEILQVIEHITRNKMKTTSGE